MSRFITTLLSVAYLCTCTAIVLGGPRISNQVPEQATAININNTKDANPQEPVGDEVAESCQVVACSLRPFFWRVESAQGISE